MLKHTTQIYPVISCSNSEQVRAIMRYLGVVRADTYNKLGSLKGWGLHWQKAYPIIKDIKDASEYQLPSKLCEWTVSDVQKAISAQQEAARTEVIKKIYRKYDDEEVRKSLIKTLYSIDFLSNSWLHRQVRNAYKRGHTYVSNQVVYHKEAYSCKRVDRHTVKLDVQSLEKGKRISLIVKSNRIIKGQIRLIEKDGQWEIHGLINLGEYSEQPASYERVIGVDKGYTEAIVDSDNKSYGVGLGRLLTAKTERIYKKNQNRNKLWALYKKNLKSHPAKAARIKASNLTRKTENQKLNRDHSEIRGLIRHGVRQMLPCPTYVYCEDLSKHFATKKQSKNVNRKLNSWMKGELQSSIESIALQTGSKIQIVNPAYTSQVDSVTKTLLGFRDWDSFIRFTGDVLQADYNAANTIRDRGTDPEITRFMKSQEVLTVLLHRTVRFLVSFGYTVDFALQQGWLQSKFSAEARRVETKIAPIGVMGTSRKKRGRCTKHRYSDKAQLTIWDTTSHSENNISTDLA